MRVAVLTAVASTLLLSNPLPLLAADHPGSAADCAQCHGVGRGNPDQPKVIPEQPGFLGKLLGKKSYQGHPSVSCAGRVEQDGSVTGCHRPETGNPDLLVVDLTGRPIDEFCARCHAEQRRAGSHHPSYRVDKDGDGIAETAVRTAPGQLLYQRYIPAVQPEPVRSRPDAIQFRNNPDGSRSLIAALPLETVVELVDGVPVEEPNVVTCSTCHNPHYGYLVEADTQEAFSQDLVARESGDALLRLRDYNNTLCLACHKG